MKKLALLLLALAIVAPLFADDAKVMPERVIRTYIVNSYQFTTGDYDDSGDYTKYDSGDGALKLYNLGLAVEYGATDWITAAVQWAPGWTAWSETDDADDYDMINGTFGLFAGAKLQLVGPKAPVMNDQFRFAVAPGVIIPTTMKDWKAEGEAAASGEDYVDPFTWAAVTKPSFALGARVYGDYIVNENIFLNLYMEYKKFLPGSWDLADWATAVDYSGFGLTADKFDFEYDFNYEMTFEFEPHYETNLSDGLSFSAGLPVVYTMAPKATYTITSKFNGGPPESETEVELDESYSLGVNPNVGLFVTSLPLPMEFTVSYKYPLMGKNTPASHTITSKIKFYAKS